MNAMADIKEIHKSSIFDSTCQTIVNTVNCVGIMGRGLALEFKMRFPDMYEHYRSVCKRGDLQPGMLLLYKETDPWILNFPTKKDWKNPSKIEYIEAGLAKFANTYQKRGITSVAFPKLGTTSGKLKWEDVRSIMYKHLSPLTNIQIEIYHFEPAAKDIYFDKFYQKVQRFTEDDYIQILGLKRHQAKLLYNGIVSGMISTMFALQSVKGIGEETIKTVYEFVNSPAKRVATTAERQMNLF